MSIIGTVAAILTTSAFVPQAIKTIRTRNTEGLSLPTFTMLFPRHGFVDNLRYRHRRQTDYLRQHHHRLFGGYYCLFEIKCGVFR